MSLRMRAVRLVIRIKVVLQRIGLAPGADAYTDCVDGYRYPAFLLDALRRSGVRRIEVPARDAIHAWGAVGLERFLFATRLVPEGDDPSAPIVVSRDPDRAPGEHRSHVRVSVDWFTREGLSEGLAMPYFPHPELRGEIDAARGAPELASGERPFRIGFAGTIHGDAYREAFSFPVLSRADVFDELLERFGERVAWVRSKGDLEGIAASGRPIVLAAANDPGDSTEKHLLRGRDYLAFLARCGFFLAPPGYRMPTCHNLVEAMAMGAVPILDYADWLPEPLEDGVDCLRFTTRAELVAAIERALAMDEDEIGRLRAGVLAYYAERLSPESFAARLGPLLESSPTIVVNAERLSVAAWQEREGGRIGGSAR